MYKYGLGMGNIDEMDKWCEYAGEKSRMGRLGCNTQNLTSSSGGLTGTASTYEATTFPEEECFEFNSIVTITMYTGQSSLVAPQPPIKNREMK